MTYRIEFAPGAIRSLGRLKKSRPPIADRIKKNIDSLAADPFRGKKLLGELSDFRSLRVGDYRILYVVIQKRVLIQVVKIGHRREIYR